MNFIYDILVNFKYPLVDFYEWNEKDDIVNIKRIPIYKINTLDLGKLKYHKFKIDDVEVLKNNTKIFNNKKNYTSTIYTDGIEAIAFNFDINGICIGKSSLLLDEEAEIIEKSKYMNEEKIKYKILKKDKIYLFKTQKQIDVTNFIIKNIKDIKDIDKLKYIYYECMDNYNNVSKDKLINTLISNWDDKYYKIYDFFKSIPMNKM